MRPIQSRDYAPCDWCGRSRGLLWNRVPCTIDLGETHQVLHLCFYCRRRLYRIVATVLGTWYLASGTQVMPGPHVPRPGRVVHAGRVTLWVVPKWVVQQLGSDRLDILYVHRQGGRYLLMNGEQYQEALHPGPRGVGGDGR